MMNLFRASGSTVRVELKFKSHSARWLLSQHILPMTGFFPRMSSKIFASLAWACKACESAAKIFGLLTSHDFIRFAAE
jgi:hypothetical protein